MFKSIVFCVLLATCVFASEYEQKKLLRRVKVPSRRYGSPLYADSSVIRHPGFGYGPRPRPGYGYVRDVVVVDEDDYDRVPPKRTDVLRDHDDAGYDLPKEPRKPRGPRIPPPVKTDVIRDHDEYGYDLPKKPVVNAPYPPRRPSYDEGPVVAPSHKRPAVVHRREEHVKKTPYGVKHEVHETKHVGPAPHGDAYGPDAPDHIAHYTYDLEKTPDCAYSTNDSICLEDQEYPLEAMKYAIQKDKSYLKRLLTDVVSQSADNTVDGLTASQEKSYSYEHYFGAHTKINSHHGAPYTDYTYNREYYKNGGYLCPSSVAYVRPKRARNTRGQWKLIVNLPTEYNAYGHKYTQTLRLEKCIYPGAPCSYVGSDYHSKCLQKHNFERLLVWTYELGMHIDIFRMPVSCSCHMGAHGGKEHGKVKSY